MPRLIFEPVPNPTPNREWGRVDWMAEPDVRATELESLQACYDQLKIDAVVQGPRLAADVGAWIARMPANDRAAYLATSRYQEKRELTVETSDFAESITAPWAAALNIPRTSRKLKHIIYAIVKQKMIQSTRPSRRLAEKPHAINMPSREQQPGSPPSVAAPLTSPPSSSTFATSPPVAPAAPTSYAEHAKEVAERDIEIVLVDMDGTEQGSEVVLYLRDADVAPQDATFETISLDKLAALLEESFPDVDPRSTTLCLQCPALTRIHNRPMNLQNIRLRSSMYRAYIGQSKQGPITFSVERPRNGDEPAIGSRASPAMKRPASPAPLDANRKVRKFEAGFRPTTPGREQDELRADDASSAMPLLRPGAGGVPNPNGSVASGGGGNKSPPRATATRSGEPDVNEDGGESDKNAKRPAVLQPVSNGGNANPTSSPGRPKVAVKKTPTVIILSSDDNSDSDYTGDPASGGSSAPAKRFETRGGGGGGGGDDDDDDDDDGDRRDPSTQQTADVTCNAQDDGSLTLAEQAARRSHFQEQAAKAVAEQYADVPDLDDENRQKLIAQELEALLAADELTRQLDNPGANALDLLNAQGEDADADALAARFRSTFEDSPTLAHMRPEYWEQTVAFFHLPDANEHRAPVLLPRLKRAIYRYQLQGAYFMLLKWANFEGGLLQDEQGLGKTTTIITLLAVLSWMAHLWDDLCDKPHRHLKRDVEPAKRCPYAAANQIPIACPCELGFPNVVLRKLEAIVRMRGFPLVVVPPPVLSNWIAEVQATIDFEFRLSPDSTERAAPLFDLRVAHGVFGKGLLKLTAPFVRTLLTNADGVGPVGMAGTIILTTRESARTQLNAMMDTAWMRQAGHGKRKSAAVPHLRYACSAIVVDESHQVHNDGVLGMVLYNSWRGRPRDFGKTTLGHGALFLLSGTPFEKGPSELLVWLRWYIDRWDYISDHCTPWLYGEELDLLESITVENVQAMQRSINSIFRECLHKNGHAANVNGGLVKLAQDLTLLFEVFSLRRMSNTKWWDGQVLVSLPPLRIVHLPVEPVSPEVTAMLNSLHSQAIAAIRDAWVEKLELWERFQKKKGKAMPEITVSAEKGFHSVRPAVSVPAFTDLVANGVLADFTAVANAELFTTSTQNALMDDIKSIIATSSRIQYVLKQVEAVCCRSDMRTTTLEDGKQVKRPRKMVVLSCYPLVALATYLAIRYTVETYRLVTPDGVPLRVAGYFGTTSSKEKNRILSGFRETLARNKSGSVMRDKNGNPMLETPNGAHVLVGTIGTLGVGVNLDAAADGIIMESQFQHSKTAQAVKRIHRLGQKYPTTMGILVSETVNCERQVQSKKVLAEQFARIVHDANVQRERAGSHLINVDDEEEV